MSNVATMPPRVNGILETSLYVESPARSAEFYRRVFGNQFALWIFRHISSCTSVNRIGVRRVALLTRLRI